MNAVSEYISKPKKSKIPKLLTFKDYARMTPPDSGNYELHNGKIIYMPSPLFLHQKISLALSAALYYFVFKYKLGEVLTAPMDVILTPHDTVQPDILFISNDRLHIIDGQVKGAPDLVVEILSEGNTAKEMSYKKHIFESTGVQEYWLINPIKKTVTQYKNEEGEFFPIHILDTEGVLNSIVVEGFTFKIGDIFQ
jgi:Uma2 family endonuclease